MMVPLVRTGSFSAHFVDFDGFDGTVTVYVEESYPTYRLDKFHVGVSSTMGTTNVGVLPSLVVRWA